MENKLIATTSRVGRAKASNDKSKRENYSTLLALAWTCSQGQTNSRVFDPSNGQAGAPNGVAADDPGVDINGIMAIANRLVQNDLEVIMGKKKPVHVEAKPDTETNQKD